MKITVKEKSETKEYPWLGIFKGNIVLFSKESCGVVLQEGESSHKLGDYRTDWNDPKFESFQGEIVLSNS